MKTITTAVLACIALSGCAGALALDAKLQCAAENDRPAPERKRGEFRHGATHAERMLWTSTGAAHLAGNTPPSASLPRHITVPHP